MEQFKFQESELELNDELVVGGEPLAVSPLFEGFYGSLETVGTGSLLSLRDSSRAAGRSLRLFVSSEPAEVFAEHHAEISPELVSLEATENEVRIIVEHSLFDVSDALLDQATLEDYVRLRVASVLEANDVDLISAVPEAKQYDAERSFWVRITCRIRPQRRSVSDAIDIGDVVHDRVAYGHGHTSTPDGIARLVQRLPRLLVGLPESQRLEAKRSPYDLSQERQKFEAAKDVAALANSGGGIIVLGFGTTKQGGIDTVARLHPFSPTRLDTRRLRQVLRSRLFPFPSGLKVNRFDRPTGSLGFILVPRQAPESLPIMLRSRVSARGTTTNFAAIPIRSEAETEWDTIEAIHSLVAAGRAALNVSDGSGNGGQ